MKISKIKSSYVVIVLLLAVIVSLMTNKVPVVEANTSTVGLEKTITANGRAAIKATPDVAYVNIGVVTEGKELKSVQSENATKMSAIMKVLEKSGIKESEVKTVSYYVNPKYDWDNVRNKSILAGYTVHNTVEVTINDIAKVGTVLDDVVASGSNYISGIRFGVKDESELYNQALELAVKDAKAKAEAMGKGAGAINISVKSITESGNRSQPIYLETDSMYDSVSVREITPISEGEIEVVANIVVEFTFK